MKKWGERLKKVEQLAQSFQLNPLTSRYKPRLSLCQPSSIWKLFPRQSVAIEFAQSCKEVTVRWCKNSLATFVPLCVKKNVSLPLFFRLFMFLHLKKKMHTWVKGSTWSLVTLSCGIITGEERKTTPLWLHYLQWWRFHSFLFSSLGRTLSPWCIAMRSYHRAPFVSFILTWSSTSSPTQELMARLWFLNLYG